MQLNPYLNFNGDCEAAFKFYERCLGGKIQVLMTYGDSPAAAQTPPQLRGKIIHARLSVGAFLLMGSDAPPERYERPQGLSVLFTTENAPDARRIFTALSEKGTVRMPLEKTFFAEAFGSLVDRFGIPWMVGCLLDA